MKKRVKKVTRTDLIKIGELARRFSVLPSTIHFYTSQGLLKADGYSQGGYRLYDPKKAIAKLKQIEYLQSKERLSVEEIKKRI